MVAPAKRSESTEPRSPDGRRVDGAVRWTMDEVSERVGDGVRAMLARMAGLAKP